MKKFITVIAVLFSALALNAQSKGQFVIDGSLGVGVQSTSNSSYTSTSTSVSVDGGVGYFVADRFRIGADLGYSYQPSLNTVGVEVNAAYYLPLTKNFYYTPGLGIGLGGAFYKDYSAFVLGFELGLGTFEFKVTDRIGLSLGLLNLAVTPRFADGETTTAVKFNLGEATFGLRFYL